ncbi:PREDICTED: NHL repeat-containing protein 2 [Rhagoletis zephyria]|uniref:NHL repeat-containing protein 2 n=1 Tax=Rhagoletis zephyria TaxID=28612 RepID=UPI000811A553|nr:PREDICTED: NHL repeat-containing protein 2 [Rhagoletis zephyria]
MDSEPLDPMDILAYTTEELQGRFRRAKDGTEKAKVISDFLCRWDADDALAPVKKMKIEFQDDLDWFNVTRPLPLKSLRGKLVVLDFFTYCCINCMHILPDLHALEELFPPESGLVVVGVHSPKFENEKDGANILSAVQRYGITHPIVNDARMTLWRAIGIRCWPSLLVLNPSGAPMLLLMGEGHGVFLQCFTEQALRHYKAKGEIDNAELPLKLATDSLPASNLRFPAKIARSENGRFAVADAGNHRILIFDSEGVVHQRIGGCSAGFVDGDFETARFNSPQGLDFLDDDVLIVADTENHALRQVTLSTRRVETLAGTGQQGIDRVGGKLGPLQAISSPWDIAAFRMRDMDMSFHVDERIVPEKAIVLVAMAGTHQIWGYFPEGIIWWKYRQLDPRTCLAICGNGMEENRNNSYPQNAAFAQPSGLALAKNFLFIADSESSSIRKVSMVDGKVMPVVGGDRNPLNLFAFGDVDGKQYNAKLQHPLAVAYNSVTDKIYVADTYNHKIKVIDTTASSVETLLIKDESDTTLQLNEPAGLCFDASGQLLYVADTNNHSIQLVDMKTLIAKTFLLNFSAVTAAQAATETDSLISGSLQLLKRVPLRACVQLKLRVNINLSNELTLTDGAPQRWTLKSAAPALRASATSGQIHNGTMQLQLERIASFLPTEEEVKLDIALSLCDAKSCLMKRFSLILRDSAADGAHLTSKPTDKAGVLDENINIYITQSDITVS